MKSNKLLYFLLKIYMNRKRMYLIVKRLSISFLGPKVWDLVPSDIKLSQSLSIFKRKIKKWVPLQCPCRLCKIYLQHVGFIQWTPENSLHRNGGVPLSVSLINVWTNACVSASLITLIRERFDLFFSDRVDFN